MKFKIEVSNAETGERFDAEVVEISTHPDDIRAAKLAATSVVEGAVNVLLQRATSPWPDWAQRVGESDVEWQLRMNRLGVKT